MECHVLFLTPESFLSNAFVRRQIVVIASRLRPLRWLRHSLFIAAFLPLRSKDIFRLLGKIFVSDQHSRFFYAIS
jgi:hypothetical protein